MAISLVEVLTRSLKALQFPPTDAGAVRLALSYAQAIDEGGDVARLGPGLLSVLESLGMTPKARATLLKGVRGEQPDAKPANPLDELRARRERRTAG